MTVPRFVLAMKSEIYSLELYNKGHRAHLNRHLARSISLALVCALLKRKWCPIGMRNAEESSCVALTDHKKLSHALLFSHKGGRHKSCDVANGGCEQNCTVVDGGVVCFCWHGFQLSLDTRKCLDIDECQTFGVCSQQCVNTRGSYKCSCDQGYVSDGVDGRDCKAEGTFSAMQK